METSVALKVKINGCNFKCVYCPSANRGIGKNNKDIIKEVLSRSAEAGIYEVRWSGGEATQYKHFLSLVNYAQSKGFFQTLSTNGSFGNEYLHVLRGEGIQRINFSLDTLDDSLFKQITGMDYLEVVIGNIKAASILFNLPTKMNIVIARDNLHEIPRLIDFGKEMNVIPRLMQLTYKGSDSGFVNKNRISVEEIKKCIPKFDSYEKYNMSLHEGRNPVTEYYKRSNFVLGIVVQDFKCIQKRCYKIWYEFGKLRNCKIYHEESVSSVEDVKHIIPKIIKTKQDGWEGRKHAIIDNYSPVAQRKKSTTLRT